MSVKRYQLPERFYALGSQIHPDGKMFLMVDAADYDALEKEARWAFRLLQCMPPDRLKPEALERITTWLNDHP